MRALLPFAWVLITVFSHAFGGRLGRHIDQRKGISSIAVLHVQDGAGGHSANPDGSENFIDDGGKSGNIVDNERKDLIVMGACLAVLLAVVALWQFCFAGKPFSPLGCLPSSLQQWAPGVVRTIQSIDHLALIALAILGTGMVIRDIMDFHRNGCHPTHRCANKIINFVFLLPCTWYVFTCIGSYDERVVNKKKELKEQARSLQEAQDGLVKDMEEWIKNAGDTGIGMAERIFQTHKRDFVKFLDWYPKGLGIEDGIASRIGRKSFSPKEIQVHTDAADAIQRLTCFWLRVFQDTSVVPSPLQGVVVPSLDDILQETAGSADLADKLAIRLREEDVDFFASADMVNVVKISKRQKLAKLAATVAPPWMICCQRVGFGCSRGDDTLRQWNFSFGCFRVYIRSRRHLMLMIGVLAGIALLLWHILDGETASMRKASVAALVVYICGLIVVVCHFDNIDAVVILHMEIEKTKADRERLEETKARVLRASTDIQMIVDLWMVRTIPLLELTKEICDRFRDACMGIEDLSPLKIDLVTADGISEKSKDLAIRVKVLTDACVLLEEQFDRFGEFEESLKNPRPQVVAEAICEDVRKRYQNTHGLRELIDCP